MTNRTAVVVGGASGIGRAVAHALAADNCRVTVADRNAEGARAVATELLSRGGKDTSVPWENPSTGARGTVTPIAPQRRQRFA